MKNRLVGVIIVIFSGLMGFMIWLFNNALSQIVNDSCSHGPTCPMWGTISFHTNLSLGIMIAVALLGVYFIFFAKDEPRLIKEIHHKVVKEQINPKKFDKGHFQKVLGTLDTDEKLIFEKILNKEGTIFQSELVDETYTKVKVTRILDKLEGRGLIERRRRGMTNIVMIKHQ